MPIKDRTENIIQNLINASVRKLRERVVAKKASSAAPTGPSPEKDKLANVLGNAEAIAGVILDLYKRKKLPLHFKEAVGSDLYLEVINNFKHIVKGDAIYTKVDYFLALGAIVKRIGSAMNQSFSGFKNAEAKKKFKRLLKDFLDKEI